MEKDKDYQMDSRIVCNSCNFSVYNIQKNISYGGLLDTKWLNGRYLNCWR